jgi:hypothetical protein
MKAKKVQLEEENIQLYGKIKFLQSDLSKRSAAVPSSSSSSSGPDYHYNNLEKRKSYYSEDSRYNDDHDNNNMNNSHDIEAKYEQLYEQRINPFAAVREKQEKENLTIK